MPATNPPLDQPPPSLSEPGIATALLRLALATRPAFLVASIMPVLVGTAWASTTHHRFDGLLFALALAAMILMHSATNVYNDVSDVGSDSVNTGRIYPYTGGSRFIQTGLLSRRDMALLALALCASALLLGTLLALLRGPGIILLGIAGIALGLLYSMPGAQLSARGVGEAAVAAGFGVLPVAGAAWLQTGVIEAGAILLSIPVSCWVAAILIINEVPDIEADRRAKKFTLAVRWGDRGARVIYRCLTLCAFLATVAAIERHALPVWFFVPGTVLAGAGLTAAGRIRVDPASRTSLKQAIELTQAIHGAGCVLLVVALLAQRFV